MAEKSLRTKTISGVIWSAVQKFGTLGISFISNMVLARLLSPDDYGCIGMLAIFIAVSMTFIDGGFGSALIQKKSPTQEDYSTIFWWNLFISIVLYILLYIASPYIASFYNMEILSDVLRVQGIILIVNALNIIQTNQLRKQLRFKTLAVINIISAILSVAITIYLAYKGFGIWSLVAHQLLHSGFNTIMLWCVTRWKPALIFSVQSFKQLFGFGSFILLSNLINTFCNNIQGLLIGRFFLPSDLGYFSQAQKLENVASQSITSVIDQVSYPVFSKIQYDQNLLKDVLFKLTSNLIYFSFPIMLLLILLAEPLILLFYGEKWLPSVPYFQILCVAGMSATFHGVHYYAVASKGESRDLFLFTILKRALALIVLVIGMYLGQVKGLVWGFSIGAWIISICNAWLVSKHLGYTLDQQFKDIFPIILLSVLTFIIVNIFVKVINLNIYLESTIIVFGYISIYIIGSILLKLEPYKFLIDILIKRFKK